MVTILNRIFKYKNVIVLFLFIMLANTCPLITVHADEATNQPTNSPTSNKITNQSVDTINALKPEEIEKLLKQQYKVIEPEPSSLNPFPRLVPRSSHAGVLAHLDSLYHVTKVTNFDDKGFFKRQRILIVTVTNIILEERIMVGDRSKGIFALDGTNLLYLNGSDSMTNVTNLLKHENRPLEEADPDMLSEFLSKTILRQNNDRIDVIRSPGDIAKLDVPNAKEKNSSITKSKQRIRSLMQRMYYPTVNHSELDKWQGQIVKPELSGNIKSGWKCHFIGLRGWTYNISLPFTLVAFDIDISPTFDFTITETILSKEIMN